MGYVPEMHKYLAKSAENLPVIRLFSLNFLSKAPKARAVFREPCQIPVDFSVGFSYNYFIIERMRCNV
jgi:hypothetical protein